MFTLHKVKQNVIASDSDWLISLFTTLMIDLGNYCCIGFRVLNWKLLEALFCQRHFFWFCLQVMSGRPLPGGCRGLHALKLLKVLSPILEPNLIGMWDTVIPKLTQYLEGEGKIYFLK